MKGPLLYSFKEFDSDGEAHAYYRGVGYRTLAYEGHGNLHDGRVMENAMGDRVVIRRHDAFTYRATEYHNYDY